ncbi:hypothetical protein HanPSC8_Chr11g0457041 [Helianthus annuus]|nr:hypothetical protein HanPSC8_Chr11g0457041 [Helianthus annuus]
MAKQKIVVKMAVNSEKKSRKALKIAVSVAGVESASFVGSDKHQIALTGERIDPIQLTKLLKKGVGHTELVSVGSVEETAPAPPASATAPAPPASATASQAPIVAPQINYPYCYNYGVPYNIYQGPYNNDLACSIM